MHFEKIKSISIESELENCFDLQVDDDQTELAHSYYTNNIVSHNTEVIAGLIKAIPCPTMIFADQLVIIDQIKARLELRDVVNDIGLFYGGKTPTGQLVIAGSIQSLAVPKSLPLKPDPKDHVTDETYHRAIKKYEERRRGFESRQRRAKLYQQLISKAQMVIVDECDLASSPIYRTMFRYYCLARRRYGMSGTPFDEDKPFENSIIQKHLGSVIAQATRQEVEAVGRIIPIEYFMLTIGESGSKNEASAFDVAVNDHIVNGKELRAKIKSFCRCYPNDGTFILVERDDLGLDLERLIPGAIFVHGKTPKRRRNLVLRQFEQREIKVLIGGKIVKRGLDLSGGCENLILASGGKQASDLKQKIGRAVRLNRLGKSRVIDFLFLGNRYLYDHSRKRLKIVVGLGYPTTVVFNNGQKVDGADFIRSRFRRPKY